MGWGGVVDLDKFTVAAGPYGGPIGKILKLYTMGWGGVVDLDKFTVAAGPYGGPIGKILKLYTMGWGGVVDLYKFTVAAGPYGGPIGKMLKLYTMGWGGVYDLDKFTVAAGPYGGPIGKILKLYTMGWGGVYDLDKFTVAAGPYGGPIGKILKLYTMGWGGVYDLDKFTVAAGPYGGPIGKILKLYTIGWGGEVDLDKFTVAAGPYGGPIGKILKLYTMGWGGVYDLDKFTVAAGPYGGPIGKILKLYTIGWGGEVDLDKFTVAAGPYGGPIGKILKLYTMGWGGVVDLDKFTVAAGPYGGPIGKILKLYTMGWGGVVDLDKFTVAAGPYGGPIGKILKLYTMRRGSVVDLDKFTVAAGPYGGPIGKILKLYTVRRGGVVALDKFTVAAGPYACCGGPIGKILKLYTMRRGGVVALDKFTVAAGPYGGPIGKILKLYTMGWGGVVALDKFTVAAGPYGGPIVKILKLYTMGWGGVVDLDKFTVAAGPYGGPIALLRDDSKTARVQVSTKPIVTVYTAAGNQLGQMRWNSGNIIGFGWSHMEDLLFVQEDGVVLVYDMFLNFKRTFGMGQEAKDVKVTDCSIFNSYQGTGIAVLTSTFRIFIVNNIDDIRVRRMAEVPGLQSAPSSWVVINLDRQSRALVAKGSELFLIDHGGQYEAQTPQISVDVNEYTAMALSFNNRYLALFTDKGVIWIGSSDLQKVYCEFNTKSPSPPQQLSWCGGGAVVALFDQLMLVIGPDRDWIKYSFDSPVHLTQEEDGLRIIGNYQHEFLYRIADVTDKIFRIGSMEPGAMLYEASKEFYKGSQKADEYIRMIKDRLEHAVSQCIEAAGYEIESDKQKALLRAATFGKCFLTDYNPESFVNMCQMLRVLNQVRDHIIGIPLTYVQLEHLSMPVLIDRLVLRKLFYYAIRICQYLKIPDDEGASRILAHWACYKVCVCSWVLIDRLVLRKLFYYAIRICQYLKIPDDEGASRILAHWACYKVQKKDVDDETVAKDIQQKLGDTPGVSYSDIASQALECGRTDLAIRLLDFEPRAAQQVPLLMKMKKDSIALNKAIESGDTDLVYTVLLRLKESMPQGEFFMAIRNMPIAYSLFIQYCRHQNRKLMQDLYYQEDNFQEQANCNVINSFNEERLEDRQEELKLAQENYTKARNEFAARQTEEQMKLLKQQQALEEQFNQPFINLSLHQTIHRLTVNANHRVAESLRKEFKVPERRFWWLKIDALAEIGDWTELEKFSRTKKMPLGIEAFVTVCAKNGNMREAMKYVARVAPEQKVKCLVKVGEKKAAVDAAFENRSEEELNYVLSKCQPSDRQLVETIRGMKSQLAARR
ncbi:hypothetical protein FSP39_017525 [Pinctada imbricata]|uniref:Vacuolar protein sorting-associated protein 16 homolog n=1 Tax=Pinctada imbricata TaxID=66713 RepID=A0AA88YIQ1_PINIB|nr:hypothetical protein FSP39_017525 [Pinctada imbricata]